MLEQEIFNFCMGQVNSHVIINRTFKIIKFKFCNLYGETTEVEKQRSTGFQVRIINTHKLFLRPTLVFFVLCSSIDLFGDGMANANVESMIFSN